MKELLLCLVDTNEMRWEWNIRIRIQRWTRLIKILIMIKPCVAYNGANSFFSLIDLEIREKAATLG